MEFDQELHSRVASKRAAMHAQVSFVMWSELPVRPNLAYSYWFRMQFKYLKKK